MKRHERINRGIFSTITAQVDDRPACEGCDTDYWFSTVPSERNLAQRICNGDDDHPPCPVKARCLAEALHMEARGQVHERHVYGIRGGMTAKERLAIIAPVCPRCDAPRPASRHYCDVCVEVARAESKLKSDARKRERRRQAA